MYYNFENFSNKTKVVKFIINLWQLITKLSRLLINESILMKNGKITTNMKTFALPLPRVS